MTPQTKPAQHTPGPWHVLPDPVWKDKHPLHEARFIATSTNVEVADGWEWRFEDDKAVIIATMPDAANQQANARLIAAAPELLEACKGLMDLVDSGQLVRDITHDHEASWALRQVGLIAALKQAQTAIARAEGRQE